MRRLADMQKVLNFSAKVGSNLGALEERERSLEYSILISLIPYPSVAGIV